MTFDSVSREHLQKAFAIAWRMSQSPKTPDAQRKQARETVLAIMPASERVG